MSAVSVSLCNTNSAVCMDTVCFKHNIYNILYSTTMEVLQIRITVLCIEARSCEIEVLT